MRTSRILAAATLALGLFAVAGTRLLACGGYGQFLDPTIQAAIGDHPQAAGKAIADLRAQGAKGLARVAQALEDARANVSMYEDWLKRDGEEWSRQAHGWAPEVLERRMRTRQRIGGTLGDLQRRVQRMENLLFELRRVG